MLMRILPRSFPSQIQLRNQRVIKVSHKLSSAAELARYHLSLTQVGKKDTWPSHARGAPLTCNLSCRSGRNKCTPHLSGQQGRIRVAMQPECRIFPATCCCTAQAAAGGATGNEKHIHPGPHGANLCDTTAPATKGQPYHYSKQVEAARI